MNTDEIGPRSAFPRKAVVCYWLFGLRVDRQNDTRQAPLRTENEHAGEEVENEADEK